MSLVRGSRAPKWLHDNLDSMDKAKKSAFERLSKLPGDMKFISGVLAYGKSTLLHPFRLFWQRSLPFAHHDDSDRRGNSVLCVHGIGGEENLQDIGRSLPARPKVLGNTMLWLRTIRHFTRPTLSR